jgi:hypothetical protein
MTCVTGKSIDLAIIATNIRMPNHASYYVCYSFTGTIKACIIIENVLSSYEMKILYELRDNSLGLNCNIWDYAASII